MSEEEDDKYRMVRHSSLLRQRFERRVNWTGALTWHREWFMQNERTDLCDNAKRRKSMTERQYSRERDIR